MKTLLLFLFIPCLTFSQFDEKDEHLQALYSAPSHLYQHFNNVIYFYSNTTTAKLNNVEKVIQYRKTKKGVKKEVETKTFNAEGRIIHRKNSFEEVTLNYVDTLLLETINVRKKTTEKITYSYDDQDRLIESKKYRNNKLVSAYRIDYFKQHKRSLVEYTVYKKKTEVYQLKTSYDSLLEKPISAIYISNGKLEKTWDYSCDEKGKLAATSNEALVSQCNFQQENNDGSYSTFSRTIRDGKNYLTQIDYSKDSLFLGYYQFYNDSILIAKTSKLGNRTEYETFSEKGKFKSKTIFLKDDQGNDLSTISYTKRNKVISSVYAQYDSHNLITELIFKDNMQRFFEYSFYVN